MTEPVDFRQLLKQQGDTIERPKLFPAGTYDAIIAGFEFGKSSKKQTDFCQFNIKLMGPREDVDGAAFEEAGGMTKLQERSPLRHQLYITADALYRLEEFLNLTLMIETSGRPLDESIPDSVNVPLVVSIAHQVGQKPGEFFMQIDDTGPAQ